MQKNLNGFIFFILICLCGFTTKVKAHSVQVGYCTSCNGGLRLWVEHWHNSQDPSTTTMTIEHDINGVKTTVTSSPGTSVLNATKDSLPGCFTPLTLFAACHRADQENDWVAYDFPGIVSGVNAVITIISGNTVFTADCGGMYPASTGTIVIQDPSAVVPFNTPDIVVCYGSGNTVAPAGFPPGSTWTNDNTGIGLPANGSGDINYTPPSVTTTEVGNIDVYNSCGTLITSFSVTIDPSPLSVFSYAALGIGPLGVLAPACTRDSVVFTDLSIPAPGDPIFSYAWDFGDGSPIDNSQHPVHTFPPTPSSFSVKLTATSNAGCINDTVIDVEFISADFSVPSVCAGSPSVFTDLSTPQALLTGWAWDFDNDGVVDDISQNPTFTFPVGSLMVELLITAAGGCADSILIPVIVNPNPVVNFSGTNECLSPRTQFGQFTGTPSTFTDLSTISSGAVTNWNWDFGDGTGTSTQQNPTYFYTNPGNYNVELAIASDSGCVDTTTIVVDVFPSPNPDFTFAAVSSCTKTGVMFTDLSTPALGDPIASYAWDFGDGSPVSNAQNPVHNFPASPNSFSVKLTVVSVAGCSNDTTIDVNFVSSFFSAASGCQGSLISFTDLSQSVDPITGWAWDFDNDGVVDDTSSTPTFTFSSAGNHMVELLVTATGGCIDSVLIPVTVHPNPVANFGGIYECFGSLTFFNDSSTVLTGNVASWSWDFGDGTGTSTVQNPSYLYASAGIFNVELAVVTDSGCVDTIVLPGEVFPSPVAKFTADTACFGFPTSFKDATTLGFTGISNWSWDFDNDGVLDDATQNPVFTLSGVAGNHLIKLSVQDSNQCFHDTTIQVSVSPQPIADFSFNSVCFGTATDFMDISNNSGGVINQWAWDFDNDGVVDQTIQNASNVYPLAGGYSSELLVTTDLGCIDSILKSIPVNPIPVAGFTGTYECLQKTTTFTDTSKISTGAIVSWNWDFKDGLGTSVLQHPTYTYTNPGIYNVDLTVTSDSACTHAVTVPITVYDKPTAIFTPDSICLNLVASFTDQSTGNTATINQWEWDFGNTNTSTKKDPTEFYGVEGIYSTQLIVTTTDGCKDTTDEVVVIYPMPVADFNFSDECAKIAVPFTDLSTVSNSLTLNTIDRWAWNFDNTNTSTSQNPSEAFSVDGQYNVELIATTNNNCSNTVTHMINIWPLPIVNFGPTHVCLNTETPFTDSSTVSLGQNVAWQWDFGDGIGTETIQHPRYTYSADSNFFVAKLTVTTDLGCVDSIGKSVIVHPNPEMNFSADKQEGCTPYTVNFFDEAVINAPGSIAFWEWDFGNGLTSSNQNPIDIKFDNTSNTTPILYDVTLTATSDSAHGACSATLSIPEMITVYPKPKAEFSYEPNPTDIYDREITFTDESIIGSSWLWDFGGVDSSMNQNPIRLYPDSGKYLVTLYMENIYTCKDTIEKIVIIDPVYVVWIPNAFTPDGDGINDGFSIDGFGLEELEMRIFDRWGEELYYETGLKSSWDGFYKGGLVKQDAYIYKLIVKDIFGSSHPYTGSVTVVR